MKQDFQGIRKNTFWQSIRDINAEIGSGTNLKLQLYGIRIECLGNARTNVIIISHDSGNSTCPPQKVSTFLLVIWIFLYIKQRLNILNVSVQKVRY